MTTQRSIPTEQLINTAFVSFTRGLVSSDGLFTVYLHRPASTVTVGGGPYGTQEITTLAIDDSFDRYLRDTLNRLDRIIDLDFSFVQSAAEADLAFYLDTTIKLGAGGNTLGIAVTNASNGRRWWEVYLNGSGFGDNTLYRNYAAIHEIGHTLGLEHPFENADGDVFSGTDPWTNAYPAETVMAYRNPEAGSGWNQWYADNDLAALLAIHGAEALPVPQRLIGTAGADVLTGDGGDDLLRGQEANDRLTGGGGADELWGGTGSNWFSSAADGAKDLLLITPERQRRNDRAAALVDVIESVGMEDQIGLLGATSLQLSFAPVNLQSPLYGALEGIGVYARGRLEAIYTGSELGLEQLQAISIGLPRQFVGTMA